MTRQEAIDAAAGFLRGVYPSAPPTIVLRPEWAWEYAWAWRVVFDTQEHIDTGDPMQAPMSRALFVRKDTGAADWIPTPFTTQETEGFLTTGQYPARFRGAAR